MTNREIDRQREMDAIAEEETREVFEAVLQEYLWATSHHGDFNSAHEGIAVIEEEYLELRHWVYMNPAKRDREAMRKEAIQLAAMAIRLIHDVVDA